jgi:hypothetical protein
MTFDELRKIAYAAAKENGWHDGPARHPLEIEELIHSEISEATECCRDPNHPVEEIYYLPSGKPEGLAVEYADVLIRLADGVEELFIQGGERGEELINKDECGVRKRHMADWFSFHIFLRKMVSFFENFEPWHTYEILEKCMVIMDILCDMIRALGHDPDKVIMEKIAFNRLRGYKHNKLA